MEADENLIEQEEPTKRFALTKPIRIAILVLLYLAICVQGMTMTIFNVANTNIRAELRITEKTHAIFNFFFPCWRIPFNCILNVYYEKSRQKKYSTFFNFWNIRSPFFIPF